MTQQQDANIASSAREWFRSLGPRLAVLVVVLVIASTSLFVASCALGLRVGTAITGWDEVFYYFWLRSAFEDHDADFSNEVEITPMFGWQMRERVDEIARDPDGTVRNKYPVGWALSGVPWYSLGSLTAWTASQIGLPVRTDGFGSAHQIWVLFGQWLYGWLSLYFSYKILRRYFDVRASVFGVVGICLASSIYYYQTNGAALAHNLAYLCVSGCFWAAFKLRDDPRRFVYWALVGGFAGLGAAARLTTAVYWLFPAWSIIALVRQDRRLLGRAAVSVLAACAVFSVQLVAWKAHFGSYFVYSYEDEGFNWSSPHIMDSLFSPNNGWIYTHPFVGVGIVLFLAWVWNQRHAPGRLWAVSLIAIIYVNSSWWYWSFGRSFGGRAYEGAVLFAMIGAAWGYQLIEENKRVLAVAWVGLSAAILWNLNLAYIFIRWRRTTGELIHREFPYSEIIAVSLRYWFGIEID